MFTNAQKIPGDIVDGENGYGQKLTLGMSGMTGICHPRGFSEHCIKNIIYNFFKKVFVNEN